MKTNSKVKVKVKVHGECYAFPSQLPKGAKKINPTNGSYHIVADSETTGNHHVLDVVPGMKLFENEGTLFCEVDQPTNIRCVMENRHGTRELPAGVWEFGIAQEYNYLTQELENVRD